MQWKQKYRRALLLFLGLDLLAIAIMGYFQVKNSIPDELHLVAGQEEGIMDVLANPCVTCEDAIPVSQDGSYRIGCKLFGTVPLKEVQVNLVKPTTISVSGSPVGIYMETEGVLIVDTGEVVGKDGMPYEPAKNIVQAGDYIVAFNEQEVSTKKDLMEDIAGCQGESARLDVIRDGEELQVAVDPVEGQDGSYKLGIWVRDDTQGIGTLTYLDQSGKFGALGHGISDVDTGGLLKIKNGRLYKAQILGIQKGSKGSPGELSGLIRYEDSNILGDIVKNSENGIFGSLQGGTAGLHLQEMEVGYKQDMKLGEASILCSLDGVVDEYQVEITRIDWNHEDTNKSFVIKVTDPRLLSKTGGIVQGMSGSPVLQNGKVVGAVTHVFVQDSASGYGIFIENMLQQ